MTVKDVVELSAVYLQLEDVLSQADFTSSVNATTNPVIQADDITTRSIKLLIRCTDLVFSAIATDYMHLTKTERINTPDNEVEYSNFSNDVLKVLSVKSNGQNMKFKAYSTCIEVEKSGNLDICYYYLPETKNALTSDCDEFQDLIPIRTLAYGVASEYCFISGMFNEAQMWQSKFKDAMHCLTRIQNKKIKARRWA